MKSMATALSAVAMITFGCATTLPREQPFSKEWAGAQRHNRAVQERAAKYSSEWVLWGEGGKNRAAVVVDEKGKPRLNVGRAQGLSADIDIDEDEAGFMLKYKGGWKARPRPANEAR